MQLFGLAGPGPGVGRSPGVGRGPARPAPAPAPRAGGVGGVFRVAQWMRMLLIGSWGRVGLAHEPLTPHGPGGMAGVWG